MNLLEVLHNVTKQLEKVLEQEINNTNRETVIKEINELIEQRGAHMLKVSPPFTKEEELIGKDIIIMNEKIQNQMNNVFSELKQEMQQVKIQKTTNDSYKNPYKNVNSMDGMFLDNKL